MMKSKREEVFFILNMNIQNPDFRTSPHSHQPILTEDEILSKVKDNYGMYRQFRRKGFVTNKEFDFITKANFSPKQVSVVREEKTEEEKIQSHKNLRAIQNFWNNEYNENFEVEFAERKDSECALYDSGRFNNVKLQELLIREFGY